MSKLIFVCSLVVLTAYSTFANQYTCQQCVSEGKNCQGTKKVSGCDYCVKIDGLIHDTSKVPDMAKTYLHDNHPTFTLRNNQHVFGRGCISKQLLKTLGFEDGVDCVKIEKADNTGFVGHACTCLGNC